MTFVPEFAFEEKDLIRNLNLASAKLASTIIAVSTQTGKSFFCAWKKFFTIRFAHLEKLPLQFLPI